MKGAEMTKITECSCGGLVELTDSWNPCPSCELGYDRQGREAPPPEAELYDYDGQNTEEAAGMAREAQA